MENKIIILNDDGTSDKYSFLISNINSSKISLSFNDVFYHDFKGADLFESLKLLRKHFERQNAKVLCEGARIDVYPSRMSRQMGNGRKAYVQVLGKQAKMSDLVDIFDYAKPHLIGKVKDQENYHHRWIKSLQ